MKAMIFGKFSGLLVVAVLLLLGLAQITDLVQERQGRHQSAVDSVARSLAGSQTVLGPLVHRACTEEWSHTTDKGVVLERRNFNLVAAPSNLNVVSTSQVEARARGLHATQVFTLKAKLSAQWTDLQSLSSQPQHAGATVRCGPPVLMLAVSDARGIRQAEVLVNGQPQTVQAGTQHSAYPRGVQASLPANTPLGAPLRAEVELELLGTEALNFVPLGSATQISLSSNWPHPRFDGQFLPSERKISDQGFEASWRVSALASSAQQAVVDGGSLCSGGMGTSNDSAEYATTAVDASRHGSACVETLGLGFIDPINTYSLSDRATKYGLLFIVLTFCAVGLFECMRGLRVHPIQYFLVGAAISIFFLLLVSLSEHLTFNTAYALAASACVLLLAYYASHMLHSWRRGLPFGLGIAALYGLLFVLLQLEQTAMVMGALALFGVLAGVMTLTRKLDWYALLRVTPSAVTSPPAA
ncbi:cell envelope integrity protein CreD [Rhodoferax sp.]|uniref:cell envelope integrity protein CreD n=1 Tax=Rhodoferax sp. TaxID=50421 RepID=UPI0025FA91B0|nr:cell envelope integrity protein CreD [Rhodoferax sp.]